MSDQTSPAHAEPLPADLPCYRCGVFLAPIGYTTTRGHTLCALCYDEERADSDRMFVTFSQLDPLKANSTAVNVCVKQIVNMVFPYAKAIMELVCEAEGMLRQGNMAEARNKCKQAWTQATSDVDGKRVGADVFYAIAITSAKIDIVLFNRADAYTWATIALELSKHVTVHSEERARALVKGAQQSLLSSEKTEDEINQLKKEILETKIMPNMRARREPRAELLKNALEDPLECPVCLHVLFEPITLPTGHTVCKSCMRRSLEVTDPYTGIAVRPLCPLTRTPLDAYVAWVNMGPGNLSTVRVVESFLHKYFVQEVEERRALIEAELREQMSDGGWVPIFVCTIAWPGVACPLHVFEPRYRLMMRRAVDSGFRQFGMCAYTGEAPFTEIGTMCRIRNHQVLPDGRMFIDAVGAYRFRVREKSMRDGYHVAKIEPLIDEDDVTLPLPADDDLGMRRRQLILTTYENMRALMSDWLSSQSDRKQTLIRQAFGDLPSDPCGLSMWLSALIFSDSPSVAFNMLASNSLNARLQSLKPLVARLCD